MNTCKTRSGMIMKNVQLFQNLNKEELQKPSIQDASLNIKFVIRSRIPHPNFTILDELKNKFPVRKLKMLVANDDQF